MKRSPIRRRTPLNRGTSQLRRTRIKPQSKKRASETARRHTTIATVIERDGPHCTARYIWPEIECYGPLDADEWNPRSAQPGGHLDPSNVQLLCRSHHTAKHEQPIEAAHRGLRPYPAGYMGERRTTETPPGKRDAAS